MGKRKRVKASTNTNIKKKGNGEGETSSTKRTRGQNQSTDNKIEGGGNSTKKMKRGESSNACVGEAKVEAGAGQSQNQESSVKENPMNNLPPENAKEIGEGEPSSSSLYWTRSRIEAPHPEIGDLELAIKRRKDTNGQDEEGPINDLPPEMLTQILKCVNTRSLFNCRLVNRQWNEISSRTLRNRTNAFTRFELDCGRLVWSKAVYDQYERTSDSLSNFVRCMQNSTDCPFSQFSFSMVDHDGPFKILNREEFKQFTSYFSSSSQTLKCLSLSFHYLKNLQTLERLTRKLSDLLLNKIPRLEEFALDFKHSTEAPHVKLFTIPKQTTLQFQLPHLKVIIFYEPMIQSYTEIVRELLNAAVNLKYIRLCVYKLTDFQFLHSLGKLHLLKEAIIKLNPSFFSSAESDKNYGLLPKLEILTLSLNVFIPSTSFWSQRAKFLGNLFEYSKDTLKELNTLPFGFFPGLQLPIFTKLRKLEIDDYPRQMFPPGIRSRNVFPVVSELGLDIDLCDYAFPQEDSIPLLPRVKNLSICDIKLEENTISILGLMCQNLKKLKIHKDYEYEYDKAFPYPTLNFLNVGRAVWTHMKQLESLEIDVDLHGPENTSTALDSCFTGISLENCHRLNDLKKTNKLLKKLGSQAKILESELTAEREHPSILNMKDLKTLRINPYSGRRLLKRMEFFTKLTWISEEFAFKFIPHLKPKPEEED